MIRVAHTHILEQSEPMELEDEVDNEARVSDLDADGGYCLATLVAK